MAARARGGRHVRTVGVEEELLIVRPDLGMAVPLGEQVVDESAGGEIEREFKQEQIEIASDPQRELAAVLADLVARRAGAADAARAVGVEIAAIATNPGKLRPRGTVNERYRRMVAEFGLMAAEQLTCGQHMHVEISAPAEGVAVLDRIRGWLPILLALSSNSPFWQEQDTGYASYRSVLWGRWPSAGPTELYGDEAGYQAARQAQLDAGSALDDGMIYVDARLSAHYPTVEIRVADVCSDVRDAVLLAGLARAMVETAVADWHDDVAPLPLTLPVIRAANWRAARWGTTGSLLNPLTGQQDPAWVVIDLLIDQVAPALATAGDLDYVSEQLARIREHGTGADRQRAVFARTRDLDAVLADAVVRTGTS